jgi:hypothetical protein
MTRGRMEHLLRVADMVYECAEVLSWCKNPEARAMVEGKLELRKESFLRMMALEEINRRT